MNNINDFIKKLSIKDKKTISQKGLKLVEENYRRKQRQKIK